MDDVELCLWLRRTGGGIYRLTWKAADRIEELQAENAALRAKLEELREAVRAEHTAYSNAEACSCPACMRDFDDAYKKIERLLTEGE